MEPGEPQTVPEPDEEATTDVAPLQGGGQAVGLGIGNSTQSFCDEKNQASSGARETNAGDDFYVLWAARRALRLLDLRSGSSA
jgi:hypothetical protein